MSSRLITNYPDVLHALGIALTKSLISFELAFRVDCTSTSMSSSSEICPLSPHLKLI